MRDHALRMMSANPSVKFNRIGNNTELTLPDANTGISAGAVKDWGRSNQLVEAQRLATLRAAREEAALANSDLREFRRADASKDIVFQSADKSAISISGKSVVSKWDFSGTKFVFSQIGDAISELPSALINGAVGVASKIDNTFSYGFKAAANGVWGLAGQRGLPYPEAVGYGSGFGNRVPELGAENTSALYSSSNILGGGAVFPVGSFVDSPRLVSPLASAPGYIAGGDAADVFNVFGGVVAGKLALPSSYGANIASADRGVAFFGRDNLRYYAGNADGTSPVLGAPGRPYFLMPIDDAAPLATPASVARETGMAPSAEKAWKTGGDIFGISFPTEGLAPRLPVTADAQGWRHYRPGGNTAVNVEGTDWYMVNPTRELVIDGGAKIPSGSVVFRFGENGEWIPLWRY